jgi:hypothetical protein
LKKNLSPSSSRSNSRELPNKNKHGRPDSQSKEKRGFSAENSNYKGKNYDPYFDPRSSKGQIGQTAENLPDAGRGIPPPT